MNPVRNRKRVRNFQDIVSHIVIPTFISNRVNFAVVRLSSVSSNFFFISQYFTDVPHIQNYIKLANCFVEFSYFLLLQVSMVLVIFNSDRAMGQTLNCKFPTGGSVTSSPAIAPDGTIYVGSNDGNLYAINPDGTQQWVFATTGDVDACPGIGSDGTIYVGSNDNNLYAINPDGTEKWAFDTGDEIESSVAIGIDGTIYVGTKANNLYAINPDGTQKWPFPTLSWVRSSPAINSDGTIYVGCGYYGTGNFYAINPDGTQKWAFSPGSEVYTSPAIGQDGTIYFGTRQGVNKIYALNADGIQKWVFQTGGEIFSSPAIGSDGTIYVRSDDGNLYAINPDGTQKWTFTVGGIHAGHASPAIAPDGTIYIGSPDSNLYAINGTSGGLAFSPWPMFHHNLKHTGRQTGSAPTTSTDKIFLQSGGSLNDTSINISEPVVTVETGDSINGTIKIQVENGHGSSAVVPVIYTPTWGSHSTSYETVDSWADTGTSNYDVTIDLTAPDESGTYYIIFASAGQTNGSYIASFTQWTVGTPSWNDGNDLADYTESDMGNCLSTGSAEVSDLLSDGSHVQTTYGVTYIKINVINTSSTTTTTTETTTTTTAESTTTTTTTEECTYGSCITTFECTVSLGVGWACVNGCCENIGFTCPISLALDGDESQLNTIRRFRDEVLAQTPAGQELIELYYLWSPVIVKAMEEDEEFREEIKTVIDGILPLINSQM